MLKMSLIIGSILFLCGCTMPSVEQPKEDQPVIQKDNELVSSSDHDAAESDPEPKPTDPSSAIEQTEGIEKSDLETIQIPLPASMQETSYYCVPACLQSVLELHGLTVSQEELAKQMHTDPVTGTEYADLARVVNSYVFGTEMPGPGQPGYRVQTLYPNEDNAEAKALFFERIRTDLNTNDPVFCAIDRKGIFPHLSSANHMILITGYETDPDTGTIRSLTIFDPYPYDKEGGPFFTVTPDVLWQSLISNVEPAYMW